jgi:glucokinase
MAALPYPLLVADIGGTNCRVALVDAAGQAPRMIGKLSTRDEPSCEAALSSALAAAGARPRSAALAVAGPIIDKAAELTNAGWRFDGASLMAALRLEQGLLLNDFEALAACLPTLGQADLLPIAEGSPAPDGARLILGPGTGFGAAALVGRAGRHVIAPSEAGHMELGPASEDEAALWPLIARVQGRVTIESALSGSGLARLDSALRLSQGGTATLGDGAEVARAAEAGEPVALAAVELFGRLLGRVAGDLALALKATGGVFIAGGVAPKLTPLFDLAGLRRAFADKAPMEALMRRVPLSLVMAPDAAERGLASVGADPAAFGLEGRLWA